MRVLRYLKYFPGQIALNGLFNLLHVLFNLGSYVLIVPFVELMFGIGDVPEVEPALAFDQEHVVGWGLWHLYHYKDAMGIWWCLMVLSGGYLACSLLSNLFRFLASVAMVRVNNGVVERLRNDVYHKITILPVSYFGSKRRGDIISRMSNDLFDISWCIENLQSILKDPIHIIVFTFILVFVSWKMFLLFLVVLPLGVWMISRVGKVLKRRSQRGQNELGRVMAILEESLASLRAIKSFGREDRLAERFRRTNAAYAKTMVKVTRSRELSAPLSEVLGTLALDLILLIGGWQVIDGSIQPSIFIFFVIIFARIIPPFNSLIKAYNVTVKANASAARFLEILDADELILEKPGAPMLQGFYDKIEFRDVSFGYQNQDKSGGRGAEFVPVLSHVDLTIPKGSTVAIVGPSGAGKTTLVDLLPRFYDVTEGMITIDGRPIADLNINSLRAQFGLVSQNCILFNDTVANNIAFGVEDYKMDDIRAAARAAHAEEFIDAMPEGFNTTIGDRGMNLSGGQRQRLSIARALFRNTPILILDEATSALDSEAERAVQQALDELMKGRTSIVIAHRLSTIRDADLIVVLDKGHIVQMGTHDSLVCQEGMYKKLVDMQSFTK